MKLQDLASVRSGLVLSRKQAKEPSEYRYPLINLRCIQQEGTIQLKEADIYEAKEPLKEEYLSQSGDIIVRLTAPYTAVLIDETTSRMVISSNFVVIRVEDKSLLPEYLFWLLNTEKIGDVYERNAEVAVVQNFTDSFVPNRYEGNRHPLSVKETEVDACPML